MTSSNIPPSPGHLLRFSSSSSTDSLALSDAVTGAFSFASISAAVFSAATAPRTANPPPPPATSTVRHRYNTRFSSRNSIESQNEVASSATSSASSVAASQGREVVDANGSSSGASTQRQPHSRSRHPYSVPERTSQLLQTATSNARLVRVMRKSRENMDSAPLLSSTPAKSNGNALIALQPITSTMSNVRLDCEPSYNFGSSGWLTARSRGSTITVGSSCSAGNEDIDDDSVIVLDDTKDDADNSEGDVFQFTGGKENVYKSVENNDESRNDSVMIVSPSKEETDDGNISELVEEPEDLDGSICVTRHKVERVCPITKLPFREPQMNSCGHVYEKDAILEMCLSRWRRNKASTPCPVPGCQSSVIYTKLVSAR